MKSIILSLLIGVSTVSSVFASDSSILKPSTDYVVQQQQPETTKAVTAVTINPNQGGKVACPDGYALTEAAETQQTNVDVVVNRECNGVSVVGFAHVWCQSAPDVYKTVADSPSSRYVCHKIENHWVDAHVAGVRG